MRTVWKFGIEIADGDQDVHIPLGAKVLHVDKQDYGTLEIWVEMDKAHVIMQPRQFRVFGTGHDIPDGYEHVGTHAGGTFVWHVYENVGQ